MLRQVLVEVRQALRLRNVAVIHAQPALGVLPLALPHLGIGHRVLDLQDLAAVLHAHPLGHLELIADRDAGVDVVLVRLEVLGVHDELVLLPVTDGLAVVRVDHGVRIAELSARRDR